MPRNKPPQTRIRRSSKSIVISGTKYRVDDIRYFQWGDEPNGMGTVWTSAPDRSVIILGYILITDVWTKQIKYKCPYP
ncbi:MAG: hypothetical protein LBC99_06510 [Spirochaetota bacterium]|nr:hypothetical protein [Spirochaetota bacterium]